MIEAVPEILDLKVSLIKELDELVSPGNVIATNTSSIPIAELAGKVQHPGRVVGVHFFSPVPVMKLVEIVVALDTDPDTAETAFAFAKKLGKHPIRTKDRSGFIVNFLLIGYVNAAIRMYEEGFASREDIDEGMRLGAGLHAKIRAGRTERVEDGVGAKLGSSASATLVQNAVRRRNIIFVPLPDRLHSSDFAAWFLLTRPTEDHVRPFNQIVGKFAEKLSKILVKHKQRTGAHRHLRRRLPSTGRSP